MENPMESGMCNVIYVDRAVSEDRHVRSGSLGHGAAAGNWESSQLQGNVSLLLSGFQSVFLCGTGAACLERWRKFYSEPVTKTKPTIILLETPIQEPISSRPQWQLPPAESELYGLTLLERIDSESCAKSLSSLVIVVPIVARHDNLLSVNPDSFRAIRESLVSRGATDATVSPLSHNWLDDIKIHAQRACRNATQARSAHPRTHASSTQTSRGGNDSSLVGEEMVSRLLPDLCISIPASEDGRTIKVVQISAERQAVISHAITEFQFDAPKFNDDELIVAASLIFEHAFSAPEVAPWRLSKEQLQAFVIACCTAYKPNVHYHNFCHVVDVLQHSFHSLIRIGALPPYPPTNGSTPRPSSTSMFAQCIEPLVALTLLVAAIGHDAGHPGVNNGFLIKTNDPLARLYNDRSVLESYHCAAFKEILRKFWPQVYNTSGMRNLITECIMATDMGVHQIYMDKLKSALDELHREHSQENMTPNQLGDAMKKNKLLICALLIKCADISNVARRYDTAVKWMYTLAAETAKQREREKFMNVQTSIVSLEGTDQLTLAKNQLYFMDNFAAPLFKGVAKLIPELQFCVEAIAENREKFKAITANVEKQGSSPSQMDFANSQRPNPSQHSVEPAAKGGSNAPEINGITTTFDAVDDDSHSHCAPKQRCSETTEVSSAPDSAGTGKMPLSPSTQGTSIVSINSSVDPPTSCPVTSSTPDSFRNQAKECFQHQVSSDNGYLNGHTNHAGFDTHGGLAPGGQLKKKPSFIQKIGDFLSNKRSKGSSP
ncbi:hypothetical protein B0T21DRAFT_151837 [Apiosordaria backusii]|uniref:PDEase domain-containing protein n=1 Tax=Apiosordaria backusii TaxID=314023 RepID=A0AA40EGG7_9PEZI|nr:hypothetical protein B0T21DRAFT_151837 [Apiosordaria backusii]